MSLAGCSGHTSMPEHFENISVSKRKSISFAPYNLSAYNTFPSAGLYQNTDSILVYNVYNHSLLLMRFTQDTSIVENEFLLEDHGPEEIKIPQSILISNEHIILPQIYTVSVLDEMGVFLKSISLLKSPAFKDFSSPIFNFSHSFEMGNFITQYDPDKYTYYFFGKDVVSNNFGLFSLNILNDTIIKLEDFYDKELLEKHEIKYSSEKITMTKDDFPFILYHDNKLIVSYFSSSKIDYFDLNSNKKFSLDIKTYRFNSEKNKPKPIPQGKKLSEALIINEDWDNEVAFGKLNILPQNKGYYRLVKGPTINGPKDFDIFLEIFDLNLTKKSESNLSHLNSDLGLLNFPVPSGIVVKAKNQVSDDDFYYYKLSFKK